MLMRIRLRITVLLVPLTACGCECARMGTAIREHEARLDRMRDGIEDRLNRFGDEAAARHDVFMDHVDRAANHIDARLDRLDACWHEVWAGY